MATRSRSEHLRVPPIVRPRDGNAAPASISHDESLDLLRTKHVGRVVYTEGALPAVLPVDYAVVDDMILLRVRNGARSANKLPGSIIALEVDNLETAEIGSWVVVVTGACIVVNGVSSPMSDEASVPGRVDASTLWLALDGAASLWRGMRIR